MSDRGAERSRVHLLVSPDAGRGRADGAHASVIAALRAQGADPVDLTGADADDSLAAARRAVADGADRIVVVGGDGLVHLAVQAVAGTDTALGVIPVGTGNDFARGVLDPERPLADAVATALGPTRAIDAISTDGSDQRWIASVATAGFSGDVNERANRLARPRGPSRYTVATMLELPGLTRRTVTLDVDGEVHRLPSAFLAVGNTGWFGGGMQVCPDADPADGQLDVTVVGDVGRARLLWFFRLIFDGRHVGHPDVTTLRRQLVVAGDLFVRTAAVDVVGVDAVVVDVESFVRVGVRGFPVKHLVV